MTALSLFHPIVRDWFESRFDGPTEPQERAWPSIAAGRHTLVAAPTGSGKTLTAFLACIDRLLVRGRDIGELPGATSVVYVSPLRALSNDMHRNLSEPLAEIADLAAERGIALPEITVGLRTGDTSSSQRAKLVRKPPHILVTTPESLYLLLTSERGRAALATTETLIVDEIHALVRDKRGSHLALSIERLEHLVRENGGQELQRIGLSATQKPIDVVAEFLCGSGGTRDKGQGSRAFNSRGGATYGSPGREPRVTVPARTTEPRRGDTSAVDPVAPPGLALSASPPTRGLRPGLPPAAPPGLVRSQLSTLNSQPTSPCDVINVGHARELDLAIETPPSELGAICSYEQWDEVHDRLVELVEEHRSTLIFVNTRRLAERITHQLTERLGEDAVGAHHGSLAAEKRHSTERRLKAGHLKAVVATASLELGLDVGYIDLVVQIGSPRSIATFLQRIGRSGHALGLVPKGRLVALTRDELVESMALIRAVRAGRLDALRIPTGPLDVLAQQIVAEAAARECETDELFDLYRRAYPYRDLARKDFDATLAYLSEGIANHNGRSKRFLHHDQVNGRIRARKGAGIVALSNGGAIAEVASFRVVAEPEGVVVGTLDEDFATESSRGDVFLLGNTSWRFEGLRGNDVMVTDAHGAPPTIPFWRGEAPGRTIELSEEVSRLRKELEDRLTVSRDPEGSALVDARSSSGVSLVECEDSSGALPCGSRRNDGGAIVRWLIDETSCTEFAATQIVDYAAAELGAIGLLPTQDRVVFERFFDETGGMQLVVHAPFGGNVCRAWGYAMRKRFCRSFDFELQATADDDGFILSLGPQHSFPIESLFPMLTPENARGLLEQALLTVPVWEVRWRWNVQRALLVERMRNGRKVPPALQRFRADDLLTAVFPKLTGCQEEHTGDHEIPDHPLTNQTMHDALTETLDIDGLEEILGRIRSGEIQLIARDTREPSPFAYELLNANPYAFLDGGEAAERRTRAVATRRSFDPEDVDDLTALDPAAIERVVREAQPPVRNADEWHDVLLTRVVMRSRNDAVGATSPGGATDGSPGREPRVGGDAKCASPGGATGSFELVSPLRGSGVRDDTDTRGSRPGLPHAAPPGLVVDPANVEQLANERRAGRFEVNDRAFWVAAERLPIARAAFGEIETSPPIDVPRSVPTDVNAVDARVAIVRGYVETSGPVTADTIADEFGFTVPQVEAALQAIEGEGVVLRGRFSGARVEGQGSRDERAEPSTLDPRPLTQWCHRRLLARIHRLTLQGLRAEIEPVGLDVLQRFLFVHHGIVGRGRTGVNGLHEVLQSLQGLDVPAVAWERDLLSARVRDYRPGWLDELCLTGEVGWGRLFPPKRDADDKPKRTSVTRVVPVSLFLREDAGWLRSEAPAGPTRDDLGETAAAVLERLETTGASFATDLASELGLLPAQLSNTLGELAARGLVTADGFAGLRSLTRSAADEKRRRRGPRGFRPRAPETGVGRWSLQRACEPPDDDEAVEAWAWQLLRRWGVVFRDLLDREQGAPRWWRLLRFYRRAEARGEVRGGRFVKGVGGEQYALPHVVEELRRLRESTDGRGTVVLSAADPLNLTGIVGSGERVPAIASNRIAYVEGVAVAALVGGKVRCRDDSRWTPAIDAALRAADRRGGRRSRGNPNPPERTLDVPVASGDNERDSTIGSRFVESQPTTTGPPR